jgi:arylsulfatase A-like enzyme
VDVTPTVLAVLGVPAARDLTGRVRGGLLSPGAATEATVASWGRRSPAGAPEVDPREYVENLRSLGYLR